MQPVVPSALVSGQHIVVTSCHPIIPLLEVAEMLAFSTKKGSSCLLFSAALMGIADLDPLPIKAINCPSGTWEDVRYLPPISVCPQDWLDALFFISPLTKWGKHDLRNPHPLRPKHTSRNSSNDVSWTASHSKQLPNLCASLPGVRHGPQATHSASHRRERGLVLL